MEIHLAAEHAFHLIPQFTLEIAHDRVEQKKASLVAGTVGALLSRPKLEEIQLVSSESRLEAFWLVNAAVRTAYDRSKTFTVPVSGAEVQRVTALGQDLPVTASARGGANITLNGIEHCVEERRASFTFDGSGVRSDLTRYLSQPKSEISDWEHFAPSGTLVVPPQARATAVVRAVLSEMIRPVQAEVILEERVDLETIELNFRPVYALEYEWAAKGKRMVLEFDAVTGETRAGGKKLGDQLGSQLKGMVTRDLLFDVTADALGMVVPGGSIAVKLAKAVVDRK